MRTVFRGHRKDIKIINSEFINRASLSKREGDTMIKEREFQFACRRRCSVTR